MCDTVVGVGPGAVAGEGVWLAKNSDREPGEAQLVEVHPRRRAAGGARTRVTHVHVDSVDETLAVIISRPVWMWGAEMGVNERGVAIGNEAVFTKAKLDARKPGLTGMDALRLALERASTAAAAVDVIRALVAQHGQGGRMGFRHTRFTYSSSFIVADPTSAFVVETAGRETAVERVAPGSVRAISNALTIPGFADDHGDKLMAALAGASSRRACTTGMAGPSFASVAQALRDHAGRAVADGAVMRMPCAHASFLPTRTAGQTTSSMIAHLVAPAAAGAAGGAQAAARVWMTGTSSPCLSVFKPVSFDAPFDGGAAPGERYDGASLWWAHERLHRAFLAAGAGADVAARIRAAADALEARGASFAEHRAVVDEWRSWIASSSGGAPRAPRIFRWYWRRESERAGMPA